MRPAVILLVALLPFVSQAQGEARWLETTHNFGVIREADGKVACAMRLVNTGDSALLIANVRSSCGCTASDYPREPLAPGDTARVTLTYSPAGRPGRFEKDVFVYTNGHPRKTKLTITGDVIGEPETLQIRYPLSVGSLRLEGANVPFGEIVRGKARVAYLKGLNASLDSVVVAVESHSKAVTAHSLPDTVPPSGTVALTVRYDSSHTPLWGFNADSVMLRCRPLHGSGVVADSLVLHVMALVTEDFSSLTDRDRRRAPVATLNCGARLDCGDLPATGSVSRQFTIRNTGTDRLAVRRLWSPDAGVAATIDHEQLKKGKTATVTVTLTPSLMEGDVLNTTLTVLTNDPENPRQVVRLVGLIKQSREDHEQ